MQLKKDDENINNAGSQGGTMYGGPVNNNYGEPVNNNYGSTMNNNFGARVIMLIREIIMDSLRAIIWVMLNRQRAPLDIRSFS